VTKEQRDFAKRLNFGVVYGIGAQRFSMMTGLSVSEAEDVLRRYFATYRKLDTYLRESASRAVSDKQARTASGRLVRFNFDPSDRQQVSMTQRNGKNAPIQGTSADILKRAVEGVLRQHPRDRIHRKSRQNNDPYQPPPATQWRAIREYEADVGQHPEDCQPIEHRPPDQPSQPVVRIVVQPSLRRACRELGHDLPWTARRANLFVEGVAVPRAGKRLVIGNLVLEVTQETQPCGCDGLPNRDTPGRKPILPFYTSMGREFL